MAQDYGAVGSELGVGLDFDGAHLAGQVEGGDTVLWSVGGCAAMGDDAEVGWGLDGEHDRPVMV